MAKIFGPYSELSDNLETSLLGLAGKPLDQRQIAAAVVALLEYAENKAPSASLDEFIEAVQELVDEAGTDSCGATYGRVHARKRLEGFFEKFLKKKPSTGTARQRGKKARWGHKLDDALSDYRLLNPGAQRGGHEQV